MSKEARANSRAHAEAFRAYNDMVRAGVRPDDRTFPFLLKACADSEAAVRNGREAHASALKLGFTGDVFVGNTLSLLYGAAGDLRDSWRAFDEMRDRDVVSWNSIISVFSDNGFLRESLESFLGLIRSGLAVNSGMLEADVELNSITVSTLLPALVEQGTPCAQYKEGHDVRCVRQQFTYRFVREIGASRQGVKCVRPNGLKECCFMELDDRKLRPKRGRIESHGARERDAEPWRTPNSITFTNILPSCARVSSIKQGMQVHARSLRNGSCFDQLVSNALIDMYAKCDRLDLARHAFDVSERDQVSYNAIITAYSHSQHCSEALRLFSEMGLAGIAYDNISLVGALSACANLPAIKQGKAIHRACVRKLRNTHSSWRTRSWTCTSSAGASTSRGGSSTESPSKMLHRTTQ
ncbi:Pentatricopeptide repeat-containing protein [Acorus calamus]|uniref:Pentatricopeptide repeat-containing protein n=1 Tax=Acorus calamus TaxID=4465 RepID=A0AAV9D0V3_ACOCL|nr:Pentatricopeptide repeat-containing protein [Acorus calamus]